MKTKLLFAFFLLFSYSISAQQTYVPDDVFEQYLIDQGYDSGPLDNYLPAGVAETITSITIVSNSLSDFTGIEEMINLTNFASLSNSVTNLDLSKNTALTVLYLTNPPVASLDLSTHVLLEELYINNTPTLTNIDLSKNTALTTIDVRKNGLLDLDVSKNTALSSLNCSDNALTGLNLIANVQLTKLFCENNQLTLLDIRNGNNAAVTNDKFKAGGNPSLACISVDNADFSTATWMNIDTGIASFKEHCFETYIPDANFEAFLEAAGKGNGIANDQYVTTSNISSLTTLTATNQNIVALTGIEAFTDLETLEVFDNKIETLDVSSNTNLITLRCYRNNITELVIGDNANLTELRCFENQLTSMDVSSLTGLELLSCSDNNQITNIDVSNSPNLYSLYSSSVSLETLNISNNPSLEILNVPNNNLTEIDASSCTAMTALFANVNTLTSVSVKNGNNGNVTSFNVKGNTDLTCIEVDDNEGTYLSNTNTWRKDGTAIYTEDCSNVAIPGANFEAFLEANNMGNGIDSDGLVANGNINTITDLDISNQGISNITGIENFIALESFICNENSLTTLDVSNNTTIISLEASSNANLTAINVTDLIALETIKITGNTTLTSIDASTNTELISIDVRDNALVELNLKNGNTTLITNANIIAQGNNLSCINVDTNAISYATDNWGNFDGGVSFGDHCYETYVPDVNFENYLETHDADGNEVEITNVSSMGNGIANDNYVYTNAINTVAHLDVSNQNIEKITGIESFIALRTLKANYNSFKDIDVSSLSLLDQLWIESGSIEGLDVTANTLLQDLRVGDNQLKEIDLTNNLLLQIAYINNNDLEVIDVTNNLALKHIRTHYNPITELDLSNNALLIEIRAQESLLTVLNIKNGNNSNMFFFKATGNSALTCINVDDETDSYLLDTSVWIKDDTASYGIRCYETMVPDDQFEYYLERHNALGVEVDLGSPESMGNGIDNDGYVFTNRISGVTTLTINSLNIETLTGIEDFVALTNLDCSGNAISDLGLTNNTNLQVLNCSNNAISNINLSANTLLTEVDCNTSGVDSLILGVNTNLLKVNGSSNNLNTLDVSGLTNLEDLDGSTNNLKTISLSANTLLTTLNLSTTGVLDLNVSTNTALKYLTFTNTIGGYELDLSANTALVAVLLTDSNLTGLNLKNGNNSNITNFSATGNQFYCFLVDNAVDATTNWKNNVDVGTDFKTDCSVSEIPNAAFELYLETHNALGVEVLIGDDSSMGNGINNDTYVYTTQINTVTNLNISNLTIENFTGIANFTALEVLSCDTNTMSSLDVSNNPNLITLSVLSNPNLTTINTTGLVVLETLTVTNNTILTNLDLSTNTGLVSLNATNNGLTTLDLNQNANLATLDVSNNALTTLDLNQNTNLATLDVSNNALTKLYLKNGNNAVMTGNDSVIVTGNSNLECINVDDPTQSYLENWTKDPTTSFGERCYQTYVPDANFENYLETHDSNALEVDFGDPSSMGNGIANDKYVFTDRISEGTSLHMKSLGITNLTGIEDFIALEELFCQRNNIIKLDLSQNIALINLQCHYNQLTTLDLSANVNLAYLRAYNNSLTTLNIGSNATLEQMYLDFNSLTTLNVDSCILLRQLQINYNQLSTLSIVNGNNSILQLGASNNPELTCINVNDPTLSSLEDWVIDDIASYGIRCYEAYVPDANFETYLETHDASGILVGFGHEDSMGNGILEDGYVYTAAINTVTSLDVSNLAIVDLTGIANFTELVSLDATNNGLTSLDVTQNTNLTTLNVSNNALTKLYLNNGNNAVMTGSDSVIVTGNSDLACINVDDPTQSYLENWTTDPTASFGDRCYETYIHDALFENFLETRDASRNVVDLGDPKSLGNGIANDHYVFTDRISEVTYLNVGFIGIEDLTGIGDFTALQELRCNHNELKKLDVSENIALLKLTCQYNTITSLDLSANVNLAYFRANHNGLTDLDIGDNAVLDEIFLDGNSLVTLDVDTCVLLERLDINDNNLSTLSIVNGNNSILQLAAANNPNLTCINVDDPTQTYLEDWVTDVDNPFSIYCFATVVTDLNFEAYLETHDANGVEVDLGSDTSMGNGILEDGYVSTENIEEVVNLDISNLAIENLTGLENFTALESLTCNANTINALDVSNNSNLRTLIASSNTNLSTVNTINLLALETLIITENSLLTSLDVTTNTALVSLDSNTNGLTTLDISQNTNLASLDVSSNGIGVIDVTKNIGLTTLDVSSNGIEVVDVTKNIGLTTLDISNNGIDILDVTQNISLEILDVSSNNLEIVDLTQNTGLKTLNISENGLTRLNLIKNVSLTTLNITNNQLATLDLRNGNNVSIVSFDASGNPNLTCINVDDATQSYLDSWNINVDDTTSFGEHCNETNVTDRNFERYLEKHDALGNVVSTGDATSLGNGIADDGYVTTSRISSIATLDVSNLGIKGLTGIQDFTGLETLICSNNTMVTLDLSQHIALLNLDCQSNQLKALDVSANVNLEKIEASFNGIKTINLEQNVALKEIYLKECELTMLNLDACVVLEILDASYNSLSSLSILNGNNEAITDFKAAENASLTCINVDDPSADYLTSITTVWSKDASVSYGDHCYETYVSDDNFENYLETHDADGNVVPLGDITSMGNGIANDDYVTTNQILEVTTLSIGRLEIENLTGIENFIALETLVCFGNKLKALDVSKNTALKNLICYQNEIPTLDLSTNVNLEIIEAGDNALTTLDVYLNTALKEIFLYNNNLTSLSVDSCVLLEKLNVSGNSLTELRIVNGNNISIASFDASSNPNLACINVDDATQEYLADWILNEDDSTSFGVHCNETYIVDAIFEDYLETHDANRDVVSIGDPTSMGNGIAGDNYVRTANIEEVTYLKVFDLAIEDLTGIEDFTALTRLNCAKNKLTNLDVSENPLLENLSCYENQIGMIDLTNNPALTDVSFSDNLITTIDVTNNTALTSLTFSGNSISTIDLSQNIALEYFSAIECELTSLDFSHNTLIEEIDCSQNVLTSLILNQCTVLEDVDCEGNQLLSIDLTTNVALKYFEATNNSLTGLDVSKNINLERLSLSDNQLTELDLSQNINLEEFQGENNVLTNLNVKNGNNTNIGLFWIRNNPGLTCVLVDDATYSFAFTKRDFQTSYNEVTCGIQASPKVFLQGAAINPNTGEEALMRDDLRVAGMLPTKSPYSDGLLCTSTVFEVTGNDAIVDWVWVELRDDSDNTAVVASQSALLQRDGDVVATDGTTALSFNKSVNDYFIVIKHRNHLAIITNETIDLSDTATTIDFTTDTTFKLGGTNALIAIGNGILGMVSGDSDADGQIQNSDISTVMQILGTSVYSSSDMDMNGQIQNSDINNLLNANIGKGQQF